MKEIILQKVDKLYDEDKHNEIITLITGFQGYEKDFDISGKLAVAYNNIGEYNKAITVLESFKDAGATDPKWVYRLAYACCEGTHEYDKVQKYIEDILADIPEDNADEDVYKDLASYLVDCLANDVNNISFKKRVENFWIWFTENEEKLSDMLTKMKAQDKSIDPASISDFANEGVSLISDNIYFNLGGNFEFTFTCEGNSYLFYLTPYIVSQMPDKFKEKWTFTPFMQGDKSDGFTLKMKDVNIAISDMLVAVDYENDSGDFNIKFYNEHVCKLDDSDSYHIFYLMMDMVTGEAISNLYIGTVDKSDTKLDGMIPLSDLKEHLIDTLEKNDKQYFTSPQERFTSFQIELDDDEYSPYRYDVTFGTTSFNSLLSSYYSNDNAINLELLKMGAVAGFLVLINEEGLELGEALINAQNASDKISTYTSSIELGRSIGSYIYIDFITYDIKEFLEKTPELLKDYPCKFTFSYYKPFSTTIDL